MGRVTMLNTVEAMNPYKLCLTLFNKNRDPRRELIHNHQMGKEHSADQIRSLRLDFGRQTGKTRFALNLLEKHEGRCIIITPLQNMAGYVRSSFKYEGYRLKEMPSIISMDTAVRACPTLLSGRQNWTMAEKVKELLLDADYIIFDEGMNNKDSQYNAIYRVAKDTATFIHLGG